jgi:peptidoglycan/LPS O-acetylase OafA/YrhL
VVVPTAAETTSATDAQPPANRLAAPARAFRPELQGLRALAVALVVAYHVWFNRVSGGVDVFFLISGFLLTGQLLRAAGRGPLHPVRRWGRTVLRLLPAMAVVLFTTVLAGAALLPEGRWYQTVREVVAAVVFLENWQLAADSVDYTARHNVASVVQHFWSLSVQGQFFLAWPLLVAVIALAARGIPGRLHAQLTVALLALYLASLAYSIDLTAANQPLAYFHSLTRLWEFALGGLLALWIDSVALSRGVRVLAGWIGVLGLISCGLVLQASTVFPGFAALWPTGCAALVLVAGTTGSPGGVDRVLASRPAQYLGSLSYTLYLWHWPVLVLYLVARDREQVGLVGGLGVIGFSLVLSALTHHLVEQPVLDARIGVRGSYRVAAVALSAVVLAAAGWQVVAVQQAVPRGVVGDLHHPGAAALDTAFTGAETPEASLLPPPVTVYDDWVGLDHWDCTTMSRFPSDLCLQPVPGTPERRIVVVGDSHMQQFIGTLLPIAERHSWQLIAMLRGACPFSTASELVPGDPDCLAWNEAAALEIADLQPDGVVTLASRNVRSGGTEQTPPGFVEQWWRLHDLGVPVLAIRDNPRFAFSMPDCVQQYGRDAARCGIDRADVYAPLAPYAELADVPPNVTFLDTADVVCDSDRCPAEIGNVLVYLDDNHLTGSYARSMAGPVEQQVLEAFSW